MNRKEILKNARQNTKNNFWIYLAVILIYSSVSGIFEGDFDIFVNLNKVLNMIRNGLFSRTQLLSPDSEFYTILQSCGIFSGSIGIFGVIAAIFIGNPLYVGSNKFFLQSVDSSPNIKTIIEPFKNNYLNTVSVMFMKELLLSVILFGISLIYMIILFLGIGISLAIETFVPSYTIAGYILTAVITLVASIGYIIWTIYISYNFLFIGYIISDNPNYGFNAAYSACKEMVRGKKAEIFKADFHYTKWTIIALLIPVSLIITGVILLISTGNGLMYLILGLLFILPVIFLSILIEVFRNVLTAYIYSDIKKSTYVFQNTDTDNNFYEMPSYNEPISYSDNSEDNNIEND